MAIVIAVLLLALVVFFVASVWIVYEKAGVPGWTAIVPILNWVKFLEIAERPAWWILLYFLPGVNFVVSIILAVDLAERFGKRSGFAMGLIFLPYIFYPILGFGSAEYHPAGPRPFARAHVAPIEQLEAPRPGMKKKKKKKKRRPIPQQDDTGM